MGLHKSRQVGFGLNSTWLDPHRLQNRDPAINRKHQGIRSSWIFNRSNQFQLKLIEGGKNWDSSISSLEISGSPLDLDEELFEKGWKRGVLVRLAKELESTLLDLHLLEPPSTTMVIESVEVRVGQLLHQFEQMVDSLDMTVVEWKIHVELGFLIQFRKK